MATAISKLAAQGEEGLNVIARRVGLFSSEDVHQALFATPPAPRTLEKLKDGLRQAIRQRARTKS